MTTLRLILSVAVVSFAGLSGPSIASAQNKPAPPPPPPPAVEKPTPYDPRLARLSELLGAIHYLRNLCAADQEPEWRVAMEKLLATETGQEASRRERMTAAFNRGYRSFASVYTTCTPSAVAAEEKYRNEGATLVGEITARFGN